MATAVERTTAASGDQADRSRGSSRGRGSRRRLEGKDPRLNGGEGATGDGSPGGDAESPELALAIRFPYFLLYYSVLRPKARGRPAMDRPEATRSRQS
jgi:hypothetical protein